MRKKLLSIALAGVLVCSVMFNVQAFTGRKTLEATFNNIKVVVGGREVDLKDSNGNTIEPFIVDGVTYLPLRACVNAITQGTKPVEWDGQNYTIYIGDKTADKIGLHELNNLGGVVAAEDNSSGGKKIIVRGSEIVPFNLNSGAASQWGGVALDGKYARIIGKLATNDGRGGTLKIYGDDNLLGEYKCVAGDYPLDIDATLIGVKTLRIDVSIADFYNIELEKLK